MRLLNQRYPEPRYNDQSMFIPVRCGYSILCECRFFILWLPVNSKEILLVNEPHPSNWRMRPVLWFIQPLKVELQDYILSSACLMSSRISSTSSMPTERRMRSGATPASFNCSSDSWRWVWLAGWSTQVRASATWVTWWYNPSCRRPLRRSADILACYFRSPISELESGIGLYFYTPSFSFIDEKRDKNEEIFVHTRKSC